MLLCMFMFLHVCQGLTETCGWCCGLPNADNEELRIWGAWHVFVWYSFVEMEGPFQLIKIQFLCFSCSQCSAGCQLNIWRVFSVASIPPKLSLAGQADVFSKNSHGCGWILILLRTRFECDNADGSCKCHCQTNRLKPRGLLFLLQPFAQGSNHPLFKAWPRSLWPWGATPRLNAPGVGRVFSFFLDECDLLIILIRDSCTTRNQHDKVCTHFDCAVLSLVLNCF